MPLELFSPTGATVTLSASNTTGQATLTKPTTRNYSVRVYNAGTATVFLAFGDSTITAATASAMPLPAGGIEMFEVNPNVTTVAGITASGTATVYFTSGSGA